MWGARGIAGKVLYLNLRGKIVYIAHVCACTCVCSCIDMHVCERSEAFPWSSPEICVPHYISYM